MVRMKKRSNNQQRVGANAKRHHYHILECIWYSRFSLTAVSQDTNYKGKPSVPFSQIVGTMMFNVFLYTYFSFMFSIFTIKTLNLFFLYLCI